MTTSRVGWPLHVLVFVFLSGLVSVGYWPALDAPFYFDDKGSIVENPQIRIEELSFDALYDAGFGGPVDRRPLAKASFGLNYLFGELNPPGYRLVNIGVHLLAGIMVYLVLMRLLARHAGDGSGEERDIRSVWIASLAGAVFFVLHPLNIQAVTYVVQRMTSLATLFFLVSFLCYLLARDSTGTGRRVCWWLLALAAWILALASKEFAVVLPLTILAYEWICRAEMEWRWFARRWGFVGGCLLAIAGVVWLFAGGNAEAAFKGMHAGKAIDVLERPLTQARVFWSYIGQFVWPAPERLSLVHTVVSSSSLLNPMSTLYSVVGLCLAAASLWWFRAQRLVLFAVVWLVLAGALEAALVGLEQKFEHRMYLPGIGLCIIGALLITRLLDFARGALVPVVAASVAVAVLLGTWTWQRNAVWKDPVAFWSSALALYPDHPTALTNLANVHMERGKPELALPLLKTATVAAPDNAVINYNLGRVYAGLGRYAEALAQLERARSGMPTFQPHYYTGVVLIELKRRKEALEPLLQAVALEPGFAAAWHLLGTAYIAHGDRGKAIESFAKAVELAPGAALSHALLGALLAREGKRAAARAALERALELNPESRIARRELAKLGGG